MQQNKAVLVLLAAGALFYAWRTGELQLPTDGEQPAAVSASYSNSDAFKALANQVSIAHVSDTDDLLGLAEYAEKTHGLSGVKSAVESKCGIQPGKPKPLIADPTYAKQVAEQLGGGL